MYLKKIIFIVSVICSLFLILTIELFAANQVDYYSSSFSQSKMVPDIGFIFNFSYLNRNQDDAKYGLLSRPGLSEPHNHSDGTSHTHGNDYDGYNLNYGELSLYAAVDPNFDLTAFINFSSTSVHICEAFFKTTRLPYNLQIKVGRLASNFGRINKKHDHNLDFVRVPLIQEEFFDGHLKENGAQLTWISPLETYLKFTVEVLQGENEKSFGYQGYTLNNTDTGKNFSQESTQAPNLVVSNIQTSITLGNTTILGGISYAAGKTQQQHFDTDDPTLTDHALYGNSKLYGVDLTIKHYFDSYAYFLWQSEYMQRNIDGILQHVTNGESTIEKNHGGFYTQLVWQLNRYWRVGYQYDLIDYNQVIINDIDTNKPDDDLSRSSVMVSYFPTEFSKIRLQYAEDHTKYNADLEREKIRELILDFTFVIGAHAAHSF